MTFTITLSFFATLQADFGEVMVVDVEEPIRLIQIFFRFSSLQQKPANRFFLDGDTYLKDDYIILLNGRNMMAFNGLNSILDHNVEVSFFPRIAGG